MEYTEHFSQKAIWFEVYVDDQCLVDKLAFIHLIEMKFDGDRYQTSCKDVGNKKVILIKIRFQDWEVCSDANAHCNRNLDSSGFVVSDYVGALDAADPNRTFAHIILKEATGSS